MLVLAFIHYRLHCNAYASQEDLFALIKVPLEVRFKEGKVEEKCGCCTHIAQSSVAMVYACFSPARKKEICVLPKNPGRAGLVDWDFL